MDNLRTQHGYRPERRGAERTGYDDYGFNRSRRGSYSAREDEDWQSGPYAANERGPGYGETYGRESSPSHGGPLRTEQSWDRLDPWRDEQRYGGSRYQSRGDWSQRDPIEEDDLHYRGYYQRSSRPYSYRGSSGMFYSDALSLHGPYSGKGPKGYKRSDQQICEEANQRLERHGEVDASEIEVSCMNGNLTLKGKVSDRRAKREAEDCVADIYGVSDVMNELKVEKGFFAKLFGSDDTERSDSKAAAYTASKNF